MRGQLRQGVTTEKDSNNNATNRISKRENEIIIRDGSRKQNQESKTNTQAGDKQTRKKTVRGQTKPTERRR